MCQDERASGTDVKGTVDGERRADGDVGGGWFEMTAESHNSERSPTGGWYGRPTGGHRGLVRGDEWARGMVNVPHSAGKVEMDESPRREINIAQRRCSPLHTQVYTH